MADRPRQVSSRDLLEELEDGWANTPSTSAVVAAPAPESPASAPNVNELDEGWLDQLFPEDGDDEEDDEDEEEEELPDERLAVGADLAGAGTAVVRSRVCAGHGRS